MSSLLKGVLEIVGDGIMAIIIWQHKGGAKKLTRWFERTTPTALMLDLAKTLEPLLKDKLSYADATFHSCAHQRDGSPVWTFDNFKLFTQHHEPLHQGNAIRLLWQMFAYAAHYPFPLPTSIAIADITLDLVAFRRAFALLVLHGFDLFLETGTKSELHAEYGFLELLPDEKTPRIARNIYEAMASPSQRMKDDGVDEAANVRDVLYHVQPTIYQWITMKATDFRPWFEKTADRLLHQQASPVLDDKKTTSRSMRKSDLQALLRILLLLQPRSSMWAEGHSTESKSLDIKFQFAGDTHQARLDNNPEAIVLASAQATTLVESAFPDNGDYVSLEAFQAWCIENVNQGPFEQHWGWGYSESWKRRKSHERSFFIYSFYSLWSAIFIPVPPTDEKIVSSLPTPTTNLLSLGRAALFLSFHESTKWRWHMDEYRLQLDLQNSTLVADSRKERVDHHSLYQTLTEKKDLFFHIIILTCSAPDATQETFAALISPYTEPPSRWQMCDGGMRVEYVWRTSLIQLNPRLQTWDCGSLTARFEDDTLRLVSIGSMVGQNVGFDFITGGQEVVISTPEMCEVTGDGEGVFEGPMSITTRQRRLRLDGVQCYWMPRAAICGTSSKPPMMPWTE